MNNKWMVSDKAERCNFKLDHSAHKVQMNTLFRSGCEH